jgi:hypothetical protein
MCRTCNKAYLYTRFARGKQAITVNIDEIQDEISGIKKCTFLVIRSRSRDNAVFVPAMPAKTSGEVFNLSPNASRYDYNNIAVRSLSPEDVCRLFWGGKKSLAKGKIKK